MATTNDTNGAMTALEGLNWEDLDILLMGLRAYGRTADGKQADEAARIEALKTKVHAARRSVSK